MLPSAALARPRARRTLLVPEVLPAERTADEPAVIPVRFRVDVPSADAGRATRYATARPVRRGLLLDLYC
jgi:hypothetical protein